MNETGPAELARHAKAAKENARTERPDLVDHYTRVEQFWQALANKAPAT